MKKILFLLSILTVMLVSCQNYSEGERTGIITKLSKSGVMFKSWEGELKIAPNVAQGGMIGQYETFSFSVDNDNTIKCITPIDSIQKWSRSGVPVTITYQQVRYLNWLNNRGNEDYFIKSVVPVVIVK